MTYRSFLLFWILPATKGFCGGAITPAARVPDMPFRTVCLLLLLGACLAGLRLFQRRKQTAHPGIIHQKILAGSRQIIIHLEYRGQHFLLADNGQAIAWQPLAKESHHASHP